MSAGQLLFIFLTLAAGAGVTRMFAAPPRGVPRSFMFLSCCFGFGAGVMSLLYYAGKTIAPGRPGVLTAAEFAAAAVLCLSFVLVKRDEGEAAIPQHDPGPRARVLLNAALAFTAAKMFVLFFTTASAYPYGSVDALNIWTYRGVYFASAGAGWHRAFEPVFLTNDFNYPLLLPGFLARCWEYAGGISPAAPRATAFFFLLSMVALTFSALRILTRGAAPWLAALVLTGTPLLITYSALQTADVPLAFYILLAVVLFELHVSRGRDFASAACAGFALGLCAWTKNEGLLFAAIFILAQSAAGVVSNGLRQSARSAAALLTGAAVPVLAVAHLHAAFHLRAPVSGGLHEAARLLDPEYLAALAREFAATVANVKQVNWFMAAVFAALPFAAVAGLLKRNTRPAGASLVACALLLAGGAFADIIYPYSGSIAGFESLLRDTLHRFMLQIYPAMVFLIAAIAGAGCEEKREPHAREHSD